MTVVFSILLFAASATATFESAYRAGLEALNNNKPEIAESQLESAARLQPSYPQVWLALAQAYYKLNKTKLAATAAMKAETLAPLDPVVQHGLAFYYTEANDPVRAAACEARYAEKTPNDPDAWGRAIELYLRGAKPKPAIALAAKALAANDSAQTHVLLAKAYDLDGQFAKSIAEYKRAADLRPFDEGYAFELAQAYLRHQKFAEALEVLDPAQQRFDKSAQIALARGVALYSLRRFPETIDAFLYTIQLAPDVEQPYVFLGRMIDQTENKMPEVSAALATYVSVKPKSYLSNFLYAKALLAQNAEPEQIEPLLKKSISLKDDFWESHFEMGTVLEKKLDYAGAAAEYERSIALNPKDATSHYRLSRVYDRLGKPEVAARERALHATLSQQEKAAKTPAVPK